MTEDDRYADVKRRVMEKLGPLPAGTAARVEAAVDFAFSLSVLDMLRLAFTVAMLKAVTRLARRFGLER